MLEEVIAPVPEHILTESAAIPPGALYHRLLIHREVEGIPDLAGTRIALVGIHDDRGTNENKGSAAAPDVIRRELYKLYFGEWDFNVVDLGNIYAGETREDTLAAVEMIVRDLLLQQIIVVLIGGSQDITYGNYRAYDRLEQTVNLVSIDNRFDLGQHGEKLHSGNFLSHIILNKPYKLFNYANLG